MEFSIRSPHYIVFLLSFPQIVQHVTCYVFPTSLHPNSTVSQIEHIDNDGAFLRSGDGTFTAAIVRGSDTTLFYLCVIHTSSSAVIWTANGANPMSATDEMHLTVNGINIYSNGSLVWSTPPMPGTAGAVSGMKLLENGNLVLLNKFGEFVWQSFDYPTDTIVTGQMLPVGMRLVSTNRSSGDYRLLVVDKDVVMLWKDQIYWRLSSSPIAVRSANYIENPYMRVNQSGLHISSHGLPKYMNMLTLDHSGRLKFYNLSFSFQEIHVEPARDCLLPLWCGPLGLCSEFGSGNTVSSICSCSAGLASASDSCLLPEVSISPSCAESDVSTSRISYLQLKDGTQYFANDFKQPTISNVSVLACQNLCSKNCSCSGFLYTNITGECYLFPEQLGSLRAGDNQYSVGYLKLVKLPEAAGGNARKRMKPEFAWFLLCFVPVLVIVFIWAYRRKLPITSHKTSSILSSSDAGLDFSASIPGMPVRYSYAEILDVTNNFHSPIGAGGFGVVYKGTIASDHIEVAVKKISSAGEEGKKGFSAEVTTIGLIHHVNLVKCWGSSPWEEIEDPTCVFYRDTTFV